MDSINCHFKSKVAKIGLKMPYRGRLATRNFYTSYNREETLLIKLLEESKMKKVTKVMLEIAGWAFFVLSMYNLICVGIAFINMDELVDLTSKGIEMILRDQHYTFIPYKWMFRQILVNFLIACGIDIVNGCISWETKEVEVA